MGTEHEPGVHVAAARAITDALKTTNRMTLLFPDLIKVCGSVNAALLLNQLLFWTARTTDPTGFFYKAQPQWTAELGLERRALVNARKKLRERDFLEEKLRGTPPVVYCRINPLRLIAELTRLTRIEVELDETCKLELHEKYKFNFPQPYISNHHKRPIEIAPYVRGKSHQAYKTYKEEETTKQTKVHRIHTKTAAKNVVCDAAEIAFRIPLNFGEVFEVTNEQVSEWCSSFPNIDIHGFLNETAQRDVTAYRKCNTRGKTRSYLESHMRYLQREALRSARGVS